MPLFYHLRKGNTCGQNMFEKIKSAHASFEALGAKKESYLS